MIDKILWYCKAHSASGHFSFSRHYYSYAYRNPDVQSSLYLLLVYYIDIWPPNLNLHFESGRRNDDGCVCAPPSYRICYIFFGQGSKDLTFITFNFSGQVLGSSSGRVSKWPKKLLAFLLWRECGGSQISGLVCSWLLLTFDKSIWWQRLF